MSRYFFALWPDQKTRSKLAAVSKTLPEESGRRVQITNLHITLVFLGNIETGLLERLIDAADKIKNHPFALTIDQFGFWKKPQVIWLAPGETPAALMQLYQQVFSISEANGVKLDPRPYQPHMTVLRKVKQPLGDFVFAPVPWKISDFVLVESKTLPSGARYQVIENWPLTLN